MEKNYFEDLFKTNVSDKIEKKNGLSYVSWSYAWGELKKKYPDSTYTIYENANGLFYHTDGKTCWVKTGVTVNGIEHIEYLPVMDFKNKSIPLENVTSTDVNKAIQRSLTKAVARHGLGLYVYAGEDLPESDDDVEESKSEPISKKLKDTKEESVKKTEEPKENAQTEDIASELIGEAKVKTIKTKCKKDNVPVELLLKAYKVNDLSELNEKQFLNIKDKWSKIVETAKKEAS
jgi:hypothetical protein